MTTREFDAPPSRGFRPNEKPISDPVPLYGSSDQRSKTPNQSDLDRRKDTIFTTLLVFCWHSPNTAGN